MTKLKVREKTKHLFRSYSVCFYRDMLPQIIDSGWSLMLRVLYTSGSFLVASWRRVLCHQVWVASGWLQSAAAWPFLFSSCMPFGNSVLGVLLPTCLRAFGRFCGPSEACQAVLLFLLESAYLATCFPPCAIKGRIPYLSRIIETHIHLFTSA